MEAAFSGVFSAGAAVFGDWVDEAVAGLDEEVLGVDGFEDLNSENVFFSSFFGCEVGLAEGAGAAA